MYNLIIVNRTLSVRAALLDWAKELQQQVEEAEQLRRDYPGARVIFIEADPLLDTNSAPNYPAIVHSLGAEVIQQLLRYTRGDHRATATDAIAAWRLVLRTRDFSELVKRFEIAARFTAKLFPRLANQL